MPRLPINPLVDCVFKALFGDPQNKDLLLSFLNAITRRVPPIVDLEFLNPYSPEEFLGDDQRVVDVRARDASGLQFQVEVQLVVRRWLTNRIVYTWADLYQGQLQRGEDFRELRPLLSIWVLGERLLPDAAWHHRFQLRDEHFGVTLSDHLDIHTVELSKWSGGVEPLASEPPWLYFLREAQGWTELPMPLRTPLMEKAMSVLDRFALKGEDCHRYQARMNWLREQSAIAGEQAELEQKKAELEQKTAALEQNNAALELQQAELMQALTEKDEALKRMQARLLSLGLDPDI